MRQIATVLMDRIRSNNIESFLLLRIGPNPDALTHCYTTLPYDYVNLQDGYTYSKDNRMIAIDPPRISDSLDREAFKVTLTDNDGTLRSNLDTWNMSGVPFIISSGFINNTSEEIQGISPGEPFTEKLIAYEGTVDTYTYTITPDEQIVLSIEGASPMGSLDLTRTLLTSKAYLNQEYPDDTSYDQVTEDSLQVTLRWGKA